MEELNEDIKMTIFVILTGKAKGERLTNYLCFLADKCGISGEDDFLEPVVLSATTIFVEDSLTFLDNEQYDEWIDYFKGRLLKEEQYELLENLHL